MTRLPDFLVIGAAKSGTTPLFHRQRGTRYRDLYTSLAGRAA